MPAIAYLGAANDTAAHQEARNSLSSIGVDLRAAIHFSVPRLGFTAPCGPLSRERRSRVVYREFAIVCATLEWHGVGEAPVRKNSQGSTGRRLPAACAEPAVFAALRPMAE